MATTGRSKAGRPKIPLLSKNKIVEEALTVVESVGLAKFSVQTVANRLGVSGPSIYHYFPDRTQLLSAVARLVFSELNAPHVEGAHWRQWLEEEAILMYEAIRRHPNVAPLLSAAAMYRESADVFESSLRTLNEAGLAPIDALALLDALEGLALSWVAFGGERDSNYGFGDLEPDQHPLILEAVKEQHDDIERFRRVVRCLIAGFGELTTGRKPA